MYFYIYYKGQCLHQSDVYSRHCTVKCFRSSLKSLPISHRLDQLPWTYLSELSDVRTVIFNCYHPSGEPFNLLESLLCLFSPTRESFIVFILSISFQIEGNASTREIGSNTSKEVKNSRNVWCRNIIPPYLTSKLYLHPSNWSS